MLERVEPKALHLISFPTLTSNFLPFKLHYNVASPSIFYLYFHDDCSCKFANCIPPPPALNFLLSFTAVLSKPHKEKITSTYILSPLSLVRSGTTFPFLYFLWPMTWPLSKWEHPHTSTLKIRICLLISSLTFINAFPILFCKMENLRTTWNNDNIIHFLSVREVLGQWIPWHRKIMKLCVYCRILYLNPMPLNRWAHL